MSNTVQNIPTNYAVCLHSDCPLAGECLRYMAFESLTQSDNLLTLINPSHCSKDESCKYFRSNAEVRLARGFTNFQKKMYPEQYQRFMMLLIGVFGRSSYFRRRRGDCLLSQQDRMVVENALKQVGISEHLEFDEYVMGYDW